MGLPRHFFLHTSCNVCFFVLILADNCRAASLANCLGYCILISSFHMIWILFFVSFVLSWAIARYVRRRAISSYQKTHNVSQNQPVRILPEGAGLSIVATWFFSCACLTVFTDFMPFELFMAMVPGLFLVAAIVLDEYKHFPSYFRMVVQMASVACAMYILGGVNALTVGGFIWNTNISVIVMNVLSFLLLTWFIDVFRFYDGIDGKEGNLAAVSIAICVAAIVFAPVSNPIFFLIPCIAGFLTRNWYPARYLMGDACASFLGYVFAVMGVYFQSDHLVAGSVISNSNPDVNGIPFFAYMIICFVPFFDVTYTLLRRIIAGDNFRVPTKNHLYQRMLYSGCSHRKVIFTQLLLSALMLVLALIYRFFSDVAEVAVFLGADALIIMGVYAFWVEGRYPYVPEKNKA